MDNMTSIEQQLRDRFDICYVLTLSNREDRRKFMEEQFNRYWQCDIYNNQWLNYHYATPFPYNNIIADAFNKTGKGRFTKPNEYDCARNHYSIVKECYDRGFNHILILEDDICFYNKMEIFNDFINNIPVDYDLIQFGGFTVDPKAKNILDAYDKGQYWVKHKDCLIWNASMYALSRKGMEYYLAFMNKIFWVADGPLYKAPLNDKLINTYISTKPLVIQADKHQITSDIRNDKNDSIDYNNDNVYESRINLEDYK